MKGYLKRLILILPVLCVLVLFAAVPAHAETVIDSDTMQSLFSGSQNAVYPLSPTIALKTSAGKYVVANTSLKDSFGNAPAVVRKQQNGKKGQFALLRCKDRNYALKSVVNRRYLTGEWNNKMKFESDFVSTEEKLTFAWAGYAKWKIAFRKSGDWLCIKDGKLDTTASKDEAEVFTLVLCSRNDYSKADFAALLSEQWLGSNGSSGYWTIQAELGDGRTDALRNMGYTCFSYEDPNPDDGIITIDNMQCVAGVREMNGTTDLLIAFQGTAGYDGGNFGDTAQDLTTNLDTDGMLQSGTTYGGGLNGNKFHVGYMRMADRLWDNRGSAAASSCKLSDLLKSITRGKSSVKLTILGHSMGGAIAQCFAERIYQQCSTDKAKSAFLKNVRGRTFESALAFSGDKPAYKDWINLSVDTDTVPNGVVKGSILEKYGLHTLGRTIWLYDDDPETGITDTLFAKLGNIANYKHTLGDDQLPYKLLKGIRTSSRKSIADYKIYTDPKQTYTGSGIWSDVSVRGDGELGRGFDYYVTYKNNKNIGTATITVRGIGEYIGTLQKTFRIVPKGTQVNSVRAETDTTMKVKWKKQTSGTTGYQIQYSVDRSFAAGTCKTVRIKDKTKTSRVISGLSADTVYYVRIRTYQTISKKNYYSFWSNAVSVRTPIAYALPVKCIVYMYNGSKWVKEDTASITYNKHGDIIKVVNSEQTLQVSLTYRTNGNLKKSQLTRSYKGLKQKDYFNASFDSQGRLTSNSYYKTIECDANGWISKETNGISDNGQFDYLFYSNGMPQAVRKVYIDNSGGFERNDSFTEEGFYCGSSFENSESYRELKMDSKGRLTQSIETFGGEDAPWIRYKLVYPAKAGTNAVAYDYLKYVQTVNTCCQGLTDVLELPYVDYLYTAMF